MSALQDLELEELGAGKVMLRSLVLEKLLQESSDRSNPLEERSISPSVFLQCPLVTELNIRPADKGEI